MSAGPAPSFQRLLTALRRRGEAVPVTELARRLTAARGALEPELARRLVATCLGVSVDEVGAEIAGDGLRPAAERHLAATPLEVARFAVVDLETTGLSSALSEILEVGAVRVDALDPGLEFATLVRPASPVPRRITALTGIGAVDVADAPDLAAAMRAFRSWLDRAPGASFVAHNASFDSRFVERALERCGLRPLGVPVFCTRRLARRLFPEIGRFNLDHVCAHFGVSNAARHRALGDARATARVWVELLHRARERGMHTLGELLDHQEAPPRRRSRRRPGRRRARGVVPSPTGGNTR